MSNKKFETVEQAIEEINSQAEEIKAIKAKHAEEVKTLTEASKKELDDLNAEKKASDDALDNALKEIEDLSSQLDAQSKAGAPSIVNIGKTKYRLASKKVNVPGFGTLTAVELGKNKEALKYLVESKSGVLVEV